MNHEQDLKKLVWVLEASQGEFKLIFAHCNYPKLQKYLVQELEKLDFIQTVSLKRSQTKLYTAIRDQIGETTPTAIQVIGLNKVKNLTQVLVSADQVREEFKKSFSFPVLIWINDKIQTQLIKIAPNFESWGVTQEFELSQEELKSWITDKASLLFHNELVFSHQDEAIYFERELEAAKEDLLGSGEEINPDLEALLGFAQEINGNLEEAIKQYNTAVYLFTDCLDKKLYLLIRLTHCFYLNALHEEDLKAEIWQVTRQYLQKVLDIIIHQNEKAEYSLYCLSILGNVLRLLKDWNSLKILAEETFKFYHDERLSNQIANAYGFLAEVALNNYQWRKAENLAQWAITLHNHLANYNQVPEGSVSYFYFILGFSQYKLFYGEHETKKKEKLWQSFNNLEYAKYINIISNNLKLHLDILSKLHQVYFETGHYLKAFDIKQELQAVKYQYGIHAFIGASRIKIKSFAAPKYKAKSEQDEQDSLPPEIVAAGREKDVKTLVEWIQRTDKKVIVIYGYSGVGKSSLVNGGLIPFLEEKEEDLEKIVPVDIRVYADWVVKLGERLKEQLTKRGVVIQEKLDTKEKILQQLQQTPDKKIQVVLIFDQFEEFFFVFDTKATRNKLFEFLGDCLEINNLKVIFSLRREYLHNLLGRPGLKRINDDILAKNCLYKLTNFTVDEAKGVIQRLTERANLSWQEELSQKLVEDLGGKYQKIRPIELQIVGVQLQEKKIRTLQQYQEWGKEALVREYIDCVVQDCGEDNDKVAGLLLYLLTTEKETRPLKTCTELETELKELVTVEDEQLSLILYVLVGSGIIMAIPDSPEDKYQLVHDYLVKVIREQQASTLQELVSQLNQEREQRQKLQLELEQLRQELATAEAEKQRINQEIARQEEIAGKRLETQGTYALKQFEFQQIESLITAINAGKELFQFVQDRRPIQEYPTTSPVDALKKILNEIRERNRLEGHQNSVLSAQFSPDGTKIVTASRDKTARLWDLSGKLIAILKGHQSWVLSAQFSPDGTKIVTASRDKTARLWDLSGELIAILKGHQSWVLSAQFSPDGTMIVTASVDQTTRLWDIDGKPIITLTGHKKSVNSAQFSPDGTMIVTASRDKTVCLWNLSGELITILKGHQDSVNSAQFSPDGTMIVTASRDKTVRLWNISIGRVNIFRGHQSSVNSAQFSPDGKMIVTASEDKTARLWDLLGKQMAILKGHQNSVTNAQFSPEGKMIVTTSEDKTVRLWDITKKIAIAQEESLETLLTRGCEWLRDYLTYNPNATEEDRALCRQYFKE